MLRLLSFLQTPRDWTGAELAERLEVSPRTIRNDIERLRSLGYQVQATRGPIGGYRLASGTTVPPLLLDDDEAVALAVALRTGAVGGTDGIEASSMRALAKLEQVLPARLRSRVHALQTHTVLVRRRWHQQVDPEVLTVLAAACRDHHGLRFDYEDRRGSASQRRIEPHRVVHAEGRWYLVAWDTDRQDWRTFRVDRIRSEIVVGHRTAARELSDDEITALISGGVPPAARRYRARVTVLAPAEAIADRVGPWVGTVEPIDAFSCVLDTGADDLDILAVHLGLLNVDFIVTEPPELVAHMLALGARYSRAVQA